MQSIPRHAIYQQADRRGRESTLLSAGFVLHLGDVERHLAGTQPEPWAHRFKCRTLLTRFTNFGGRGKFSPTPEGKENEGQRYREQKNTLPNSQEACTLKRTCRNSSFRLISSKASIMHESKKTTSPTAKPNAFQQPQHIPSQNSSCTYIYNMCICIDIGRR